MFKTFLNYLLLVCGLHVVAQSPVSYSLNEYYGFPSNTVYQIFQDSRGHMWFGTEDGLIEFNGKHFKTYINTNYESEYDSIQEDKFGTIWCKNFSNQIFRVNNDNLDLAFSLDPKFLEIGSLDYDISDYPNMYINSDYGILKYDFTKESIDIIGGQEESSIDIKEQIITLKFKNRKLFNNYRGSRMSRFNDSIILMVSNTRSFAYNIKQNKISSRSFGKKRVSQILNINDSTYIFNNDKKFNYIYYSKLSEKAEIKLEEKNLAPSSIYQNLNRDVWIGSRNGIYIYDKKLKLKDYFLEGFYVSDIIQDNQNNYWISTIKNGVFVIPNFNVKHYILDDKNPSFQAIDKQHDKFYMLDSKGNLVESKFNNVDLRVIYSQPKFHSFITTSLNDDISITGSEHKIRNDSVILGESLFTCKDFNYWDADNVLFSSGHMVFTLTKNKDSKVYQYLNTYFKNETFRAENIGKEYISSLLIDKRRSYANTIGLNKKEFYVAYSNELMYYFEDNIVPVKYKNNNLVVEHLETVESGSYALSDSGQLYKLDKQWPQLLCNINKRTKALFYHDQAFYIGTKYGAYTYNLNSKEVSLIEFSSQYHVTDILVHQNKVYLTTTEGLVIIPQHYSEDKEQLKLRINSVSTSDSIYIKKRNLNFEYKNNSVKITYETFSPKLKDGAEFLYKLYPVDSIWKTTTSFFKDYEALQPGQYTFRVKVKGNGIYKNSEEKAITFEIAKPYYQKWWFYLSLILGSIATMYIFFIIRIKEIRLKNSLLENKIRLENNLSNSRIQTINAQMNPHFVFNAMNSIQNLILKSKKTEAYKYLNEFSKLLRGVLSYGHKNAITIEEEIKLIEYYLTLESLRFDEPIEVEILAPSSVFYEKIPPMLIQPFVENSVKHGFSANRIIHKKVCLEFKYLNDEVMECLVFDNGVGFKSTSIKESNHNSFSSEANKRKLNLLRQFYNYDIGLEFVDLTQDSTSEYSTLVTIKIPILD